MMKVLIRETMACFVDFYHEVEIDDSTDESDVTEAAIDKVSDGEYDYIGHEVQDCIDYYEACTEVVDSLPFSIDEG
jgi:hypothetical protein